MYDFGQATVYMMLAAADLASALATRQSSTKQARRVLGLPGGYRAVFLIGLGYPAGRALRPLIRPNRRPFDEVVHWHHW
jgi:nitroreductase